MKKIIALGLFSLWIFGAFNACAMRNDSNSRLEKMTQSTSIANLTEYVDHEGKKILKKKGKVDVVSVLKAGFIRTGFIRMCNILDNKGREKVRLIQNQLDEGDQRLTLLTTELNKVETESQELAKKIELKQLISRVVLQNGELRTREITLRSMDIRDLDIFERRAKVEEFYRAFSLFEDIYGREDLGVKATYNDLHSVKNWLNTTQVDVVLQRYGISLFKHDKNNFNGTYLSLPLRKIKNEIEERISTLDANEGKKVKTFLNKIFQTNAADDRVDMKWKHPVFWGHHTDELIYEKNGEQKGRYFKEYGGGWWETISGFLGNMNGKAVFRWTCWDDVNYAWNQCFLPRFNRDFETTVDAIKRRTMLLFDFETNPESELQKFYRQVRIVPELTLPFPSESFDRLATQFNEFLTSLKKEEIE